MVVTAAALAVQESFIDALEYLPRAAIVPYRKGQRIFDCDQPSNSLYLVVDGKVKVCHGSSGQRQVVIDIYHRDDLFGEAAFMYGSQHDESAVALERTLLMSWTVKQINEIISREPNLALGLTQVIVQRSMELKNRIQSFASDDILTRLAGALLRFSGRFGDDLTDGCLRIPPLTHALLAQYVGTSREMITHQMNQLRRAGCLTYSRQGILLHRIVVEEWLRQRQQPVSPEKSLASVQ